MRELTSQQTFRINDVKRVETGVDGGHAYLTGRCAFDGAIVSVTVLFRDAQEPNSVSADTIYVVGTISDYSQSAGLLLRDAMLIDF